MSGKEPSESEFSATLMWIANLNVRGNLIENGDSHDTDEAVSHGFLSNENTDSQEDIENLVKSSKKVNSPFSP